jgi:hypothetical protein
MISLFDMYLGAITNQAIQRAAVMALACKRDSVDAMDT